MKVAINGFGRIGKLVFRAFLEKNIKGVDIVAINELGSLDSSLHLMQYDSIHGKLRVQINKTLFLYAIFLIFDKIIELFLSFK